MSNNRTFAKELSRAAMRAQQAKREADERTHNERLQQKLLQQREDEKRANGTSEYGLRAVEEMVEKVRAAALLSASKGSSTASINLSCDGDFPFVEYRRVKKSFWSGGKYDYIPTPIWGKKLIGELQKLGFSINVGYTVDEVDCPPSCDCDCPIFNKHEKSNPYVQVSW